MLKYASTFSTFNLKPTLLIHEHTKFNMLLVKALHIELKNYSACKVNPGYHFQTRKSSLGFVTFPPALISNSVLYKLFQNTCLLQKSTMM